MSWQVFFCTNERTSLQKNGTSPHLTKSRASHGRFLQGALLAEVLRTLGSALAVVTTPSAVATIHQSFMTLLCKVTLYSAQLLGQRAKSTGQGCDIGT